VTGLNPFWVLISLLTGARIGGLLGVVVAVPMAVMIKEAIAAVRSLPAEEDQTLSIPPVKSHFPEGELKQVPSNE
jgi:predicted PurR-regulated permease PerM